MTIPHGREHFRIILVASLILLVVQLAVASAAQAAVCSATAFTCPPTGTCIITGTWDIGSDCLLDFGATPIEVRGTLQAEIVGGSFAVAAPSVRLNAGKLKSIGDATTSGGGIKVITAGTFVMEGSGPRIDTSGIGGGGDIEVVAQSAAVSTGIIVAEGGTGEDCGDGGDVRIEVAQGLTVATVIRSNTAGSDCSGGSIALTGSSVNITGEINARGGAGAQDDAITITATNGNVDVSSSALLRADGTGQSDGVGSDGGQIAISAPLGSVTVAGPVTTTGNAPEGVAGSVSISTGGTVQVTGAVNVSGAGTGAGGSVIIGATGAVSVGAEIRAIGGNTYPGGQGGTVQVRSQGSVTVASCRCPARCSRRGPLKP